MSDNRNREMMQRVQIGLTGLAGVVLLVGLANIVIEKAAVEEEVATTPVDGAPPVLVAPGSNAVAPEAAEEPGPEPLAELGVTPAPPGKAEKPPQGQTQGQVVPDLEPNPELDKPMDREP